MKLKNGESNNIRTNHLIYKKKNNILQKKEKLKSIKHKNKKLNSNVIREEINDYLLKIKNAISSKLHNDILCHGKVCNVNIRIDNSGKIIYTKVISGDKHLCDIAIKALKNSQIPKPKNIDIYKVFENISIEFAP